MLAVELWYLVLYRHQIRSSSARNLRDQIEAMPVLSRMGLVSKHLGHEAQLYLSSDCKIARISPDGV